MKKIMLILALAAITSGCAPKYKIAMVNNDRITKAGPETGTVHTRAVGEAITSRIDAHTVPVFTATQNIKIPKQTALDITEIKSGSSCKIEAVYENGLNFCHIRPEITNEAAFSPGMPMCLLVDNSGNVKNITWCHIPGDEILPEPLSSISLVKSQAYVNPSFSQELLYNGRNKDSIKLLYREFQNDMARPAFSQELTYEVDAKIVGFRNARIEVIEATNTYIKYKIAKGL